MQIDDLPLCRHDYKSSASLFNAAVISDDCSVFPFNYICVGKYRLLNELEDLMDIIILRIDRLP